MVRMELGEESRVKDIISMDPGTFLRSIVLPVDQIFQPGTSSPGVQDVVDVVDGLLFHRNGRRRHVIRGRN